MGATLLSSTKEACFRPPRLDFNRTKFTPNLLVNLLRIYSIRLEAQNIMLLKQKKENYHKYGVNFK